MRRFPVVALLLLTAAACMDEGPAQVDPQLASVSSTGPAGEALYSVTVYNLTGGQAFTPPLAALHRQSIALFEVGQAASLGVQEIAENGNLGPMIANVESNKHVSDFAVTFGPTAPPVLPGEMVQFELEASEGAKYLSIVSMLICTNDGFTGVNSVRLPKRIGESTTEYAAGYDAGTEINTEDFADIVPPCPALSGVESMDMGTGMTNPALAEDGVIRMHPGIAGTDDLDPAIHGWTDPVAMIRVERIG